MEADVDHHPRDSGKDVAIRQLTHAVPVQDGIAQEAANRLAEAAQKSPEESLLPRARGIVDRHGHANALRDVVQRHGNGDGNARAGVRQRRL